MNVAIERIGNHNFDPPTLQHREDVCVDLQANIEDPVMILPGEDALIGTGWAMTVPKDVGMFLYPRSGLGAKHGIVLGNLVGVIDGGYRQEVKVCVWNRSDDPYAILPGDRIAQAAFVPIVRPTFVEVDSVGTTDRGDGFGSSGR